MSATGSSTTSVRPAAHDGRLVALAALSAGAISGTAYGVVQWLAQAQAWSASVLQAERLEALDRAMAPVRQARGLPAATPSPWPFAAPWDDPSTVLGPALLAALVVAALVAVGALLVRGGRGGIAVAGLGTLAAAGLLRPHPPRGIDGAAGIPVPWLMLPDGYTIAAPAQDYLAMGVPTDQRDLITRLADVQAFSPQSPGWLVAAVVGGFLLAVLLPLGLVRPRLAVTAAARAALPLSTWARRALVAVPLLGAVVAVGMAAADERDAWWFALSAGEDLWRALAPLGVVTALVGVGLLVVGLVQVLAARAPEAAPRPLSPRRTEPVPG